ncbi:HAD family hydrolase [Paenibacillus chitinolyticus]|uniref:HAD family hydrolase n=1 Tax=Paenibacillus chitinolyticus TaxID=79263 RepID=UPI001C47CC64|nr:HAD family hydrolase [Paenibacillus chitinolyticus]MBV6714223.1 HAD family hydrolase [Paenibacillus chitinolyticus]
MSPFFFPAPKKLVFFDMNNTLVDRRQCFDSAFTEVLGDYTGRWEQEEGAASPEGALQIYKQEWQKLRKLRPRGHRPSEEMRIACLEKALDAFPISVNETFAKGFFEQIEETEGNYVRLFPGVEETLASLGERYKLAVISNGSRKRLERDIGRLRLSSFFPEELLFSSTKDGPRKPHPGLYRTALKETGIAPGQGVMVGNSWKNDIIGSTRCGLDAVWIYPPHVKKISQRKVGRQKVIIVRSVKQLVHVL